MALTIRELAAEAGTVVRDVVEHHVTRRFRTLTPTVLHVNVNLRCNTTCAMCNIWELKAKDTLSLEQMEAIFSDPVYARVEYIILAGGEPTLRKDLPEIVELLHRHMPRVRKILIPSNVINRASIERQYPRIARYCADHRIRLSLGVSLDGVGETHDRVRGVKGAFEKVMGNIAFLQELQRQAPFGLSLDPTIFSMNLHELDRLQALADQLGMPINFQIAAVADDYYHNAEMEDVLRVDAEGRSRIARFLERRVAEASLLDAVAYYYAETVEHLQGAPARGLPCPFVDQGLLLNPDGSLQYCHNSRVIGNALETGSGAVYHDPANLAYRKEVQKGVCPTCRMSCLFFVSLRKELFPFLAFVGKRLLGVHRLHWRRPRSRSAV